MIDPSPHRWTSWSAESLRVTSIGQIMRQLHASHFFVAFVGFKEFVGIARLHDDDEEMGDSAPNWTVIASSLRNGIDVLGLRASAAALDRILKALATDGITWGEAKKLGVILDSRLEDELNGLHVVALDLEATDLASRPIPFGVEVGEKFPSAIRDVEEAARCLAFGRGTAAVFHLMRCTEAGLKVLAKELGIPYAPSWESYLSQINTKIAQPHKKKPRSWKKRESFFKEIAGDLVAVKVAWRNPTMHIVNHYSPEQANDVFRAVRGLMQHLAKELSE